MSHIVAKTDSGWIFLQEELLERHAALRADEALSVRARLRRSDGKAAPLVNLRFRWDPVRHQHWGAKHTYMPAEPFACSLVQLARTTGEPQVCGPWSPLTNTSTVMLARSCRTTLLINIFVTVHVAHARARPASEGSLDPFTPHVRLPDSVTLACAPQREKSTLYFAVVEAADAPAARPRHASCSPGEVSHMIGRSTASWYSAHDPVLLTILFCARSCMKQGSISNIVATAESFLALPQVRTGCLYLAGAFGYVQRMAGSKKLSIATSGTCQASQPRRSWPRMGLMSRRGCGVGTGVLKRAQLQQ